MSQALWQDEQAVFVHMVQCPQALPPSAWVDVHSPYVELLAMYANRDFGGIDEATVTQMKRLWRALKKQNDEDQDEGCLNNYSGLQLIPRYIWERRQLVWALDRWFGPLAALWWYYWRLQHCLSMKIQKVEVFEPNRYFWNYFGGWVRYWLILQILRERFTSVVGGET